MSQENAVIAVYASHSQAEEALKELQRSGFDMKRLSIVGKDYHTDEQVVGYYNAGDRMKRWGATGAYWGGIWSLLFGTAFFAIPGLGPVVMAGPVVGWVLGALESALVVGGLGVLGAGLVSWGIPKDSVVEYEAAIRADRFVLMAQGTAEEVARAQVVMGKSRPESVAVHETGARVMAGAGR